MSGNGGMSNPVYNFLSRGYRPTEASHVYIAGVWGASANGVEGQHPAGDPGDEVPGDGSRGEAPGIFCHFRHFRCK